MQSYFIFPDNENARRPKSALAGVYNFPNAFANRRFGMQKKFLQNLSTEVICPKPDCRGKGKQKAPAAVWLQGLYR